MKEVKAWKKQAGHDAEVALDAALEGAQRDPSDWGFWWALPALSGQNYVHPDPALLGISWLDLVRAGGNTRQVRDWSPPSMKMVSSVPFLMNPSYKKWYWVEFPVREQDYAGWWGAPDPGAPDTTARAGTDIVPMTMIRALQLCNRLSALCGLPIPYPYRQVMAGKEGAFGIAIPTGGFRLPAKVQYVEAMRARYDDWLDRFDCPWEIDTDCEVGVKENLPLKTMIGRRNHRPPPSQEPPLQPPYQLEAYSSVYQNGQLRKDYPFPLIGSHCLPCWLAPSQGKEQPCACPTNRQNSVLDSLTSSRVRSYWRTLPVRMLIEEQDGCSRLLA